jgi:V/A-type H+/Na+-transporting ATPase subunit I
MARVELLVPEQDIVVVTEALAESHAFHVAEWKDEPAVQAAPVSATPGRPAERVRQTNPWLERASIYVALERRIVEVMDLLGVDAGTPPDTAFHMINPEVAERDIDTLEEEAKGPVEQLTDEHNRLARLRRLREQVESLVGLDVKLDLFREAHYLFSILGTMPADNVERLKTSLEHLPSAVIVVGERSRVASVVLFGLRRDVETLTRAARSAYLNPFELPDAYSGTPEEAAQALDAEIARTEEHIAALQATLHHLHDTRIRRLRHLLWRIRASRKLAETVSGFRRARYSYLVAGWVLEAEVDKLRVQVGNVSEATAVEVRSPTAQEQEEVPFEFSNPPAIRIFEPLVQTYGHPRYTRFDPTPLVALTFPLLFGIMFGDVGHGLFLVLLGALLISGRVPALRGVAAAGNIVAICGAMATIFGVLYGALFGFDNIIQPLWLRPLERTTDILLFAIAFGVVTLTLGMVYHVIDVATTTIHRPSWRWGEAILDRNGVAGIVFYWSLIGMGALFMGAQIPVGTGLLLPVAIVSGMLIALAALVKPALQGEPVGQEEGLVMTITEGFFELFETLLSMMSNTLSYVRIGAFAIAHGALSLVVFILANMVDPGRAVGYWIVVVLGNLVVIGFEGIIVGIQTLRLEYYELFSKFYDAGGTRYHPLNLAEGTGS